MANVVAISSKWASLIGRNSDLLLVAAFIAMLVAIIIPLPPFVLDFLLITNIAMSIIILITSIYVVEPLQFSVFPSLLLMTTFFRLALNVATTRLILGNATPGTNYFAGKVIYTFGWIVGGGNYVVGFVIFMILVVIQFVVITKGSTRISEVAARFTLDAMPGKQLSIDSDLNAGLISESEARARREKIGREADFYGAMDGASKFVRGDAIAGIIIVIVNIVGGLIIGYLTFGDLAAAARLYTILTIGDGLVTQIPALIIAISAGLVVTRATARENLGRDFFGQLFSQPRSLFIAAGFLAIMLFARLPVVPVIVLGLLCVFIAVQLQWFRKSQTAARAKDVDAGEAPKPEKVESLLLVDPIGLEFGYGLIKLFDASQGGDLLDRVAMIRRQVALEMGLVIPLIRMRDNLQLEPNRYEIKLKGVPVALGEAVSDRYLAMDSGTKIEGVEGIPTKEPVFGLPAIWVDAAGKQQAEALGYTVIDPTSVIITHLLEVVKNTACEILTREDVHTLLENLKEVSPTIVKEVVPDIMKPAEIHLVLQALLKERVSIRDLGTILETLSHYAARTKDVEVLVECVRTALARQVCRQYMEKDGKLYVVTIDPELEDKINAAVERTDRMTYLSLSPMEIGRITGAISEVLEELLRDGHLPVVLCSPQIRLQVKRMMDTVQSGIVVLSYNEIVKDLEVQSLGMAVCNK